MNKIKLINGDVTKPIGNGSKFILHCANNLKVMGSGVAWHLRTKWPKVYESYIKYNDKETLPLGSISLANVEPNLWVVNMVGQRGIGLDSLGNPPVRYKAVQAAFDKILYMLNTEDKYPNPSIHVPYKMCSDRAGGDWKTIVKMLETTFCNHEIPVTAYKFEG